MSEPTRYELFVSGHDDGLEPELCELVSDKGEWVRYEDVAALTAQLAEARCLIDRLDCTRREGGVALHCRLDMRCTACALAAAQAEATALREALEPFAAFARVGGFDGTVFVHSEAMALYHSATGAFVTRHDFERATELLGAQPPTGGR